jgi:hypothetical protein
MLFLVGRQVIAATRVIAKPLSDRHGAAHLLHRTIDPGSRQA